jgi:hypothetical protein
MVPPIWLIGALAVPAGVELARAVLHRALKLTPTPCTASHVR